jgi:hypothetical protein
MKKLIKTLRGRVTTDDFKYGVKRDPYNCPIALSLKRFPELSNITVGIGEIFLSYNRGMCRQVKSPRKFATLVRNFDKGNAKDLKPVSYKILLYGKD